MRVLRREFIGHVFVRSGESGADALESIRERLNGAAHESRTITHLDDDALVLSAALSPAEEMRNREWAALEAVWDTAVSRHPESVLGEARIYAAWPDREVRIRTADPALFTALREPLPGPAAERPVRGTAWRVGVAMWEATRLSAGRGPRRFVAAVAPSAGPAAEPLAWADDRPPPLARYLLYAARLRLVAGGDAARSAADSLLRARGELAAMAGGLSGLAAGGTATGGIFADDEALVASLLRRPEDESTAPGSRPDEPDDDPRRNVFVIYGRDEKARRAIFDFLRALGLRPLEWETLLGQKRDVASYLGEAVRTGLDAATAVVALMTPDDVVRLHPELHGPGEKAGETASTLQPRPNVLLELGMALAVKEGKTVLLKAGDQRDITDLGGHSYIRLADTAECRTRIRQRLEAVGCLTSASTDWLTAGDFATLTALRRQP